jgi:CubicO group peptidase (beta-lactamase class C family)
MGVQFKSFGFGLALGAAGMLVLCVLLLFAVAWVMLKRENAAKIDPPPAFCPAVGDEAVTGALKPILQKFNLPAMAAAVVTDDGIKFAGAVGVRKRGTDIPVGLDDLWHLGSDEKAMTATLIARLVQR